MEKLQGVQSAAARWVLQIRRKDWSLRGGLKRLGWLSVVQQAAYCSVKMAIQVLQRRSPERLYEALTEENEGRRVRKVITEDAQQRMKLSCMKSWSVRVLRWMDMMREDMLMMDTTKKQEKERLKLFIKHRVGVRGDKVFWGKLLKERGQEERQSGRDQERDGGGENIVLDENNIVMEEELNPPQVRGVEENGMPQDSLEDGTLPGGGREEETSRGGGREDRIPPEEGTENLMTQEELQKDKTQQERGLEDTSARGGVEEGRTRGGVEDQRSLPLTQQGLSPCTESSRAGPLSDPGKHKRVDVNRTQKDEDILQWETVFENLFSHVHPDGLQLWLEGAGQGGRLYLRRSNKLRRTGVG